MLFKFIPATLATLSFLSSVSAWEELAHSTIAYVAMHLLLPQAKLNTTQIIQAIPPVGGIHRLPPPQDLLDVANWAHDYSYTPEGAWFSALQYVNVTDNPPTSCGVDFARNCNEPAGCIITAIRDYTGILQTSSHPQNKGEALKFLVSLIGDVTEPLNAEGLGRFGYDIPVIWNGDATNLHYAWGKHMVEKLAGNDPSALDYLAVTLIEEIQQGEYKSSVSSWLSCTDINQAQNCAMEWASDANALICSHVLKQNPAGLELNGAYYDDAAPIIRMQLAKGGLRLAAWLNTIFTGSTGF